MGLGYQNEGFEFDNINDLAITNNLFDGDEVIVFVNAETGASGSDERHFTYYDKDKNTLSGKNGGILGAFTWAKVVRSGARNIASVPVGSVSSLKNPLVGNKIIFENKSILNTGATEFKNIWKGFCNCGEQSNANPFVTGEKGQLRAWRSWTYLTGRTQEGDDGELNIRNDGDLTDYQTFWHTGSAFLAPQYEKVDEKISKWQFVTEVENFNPVGQEIENKDALERFSMAQFGYGRNLPVGVSNNSEYRETGFDGFEDYDYGDCNDDHFSWRRRANDTESGLERNEAHTGKSSYRVNGNSSSRIVKNLYIKCEEEEK